MDNSGKLDLQDTKILELLKADARLSYTEIGEQVGLSRVAVKNRVTVMEQSGVIAGYKAIVDGAASPAGVRFFMDIKATPESYEKTIAYLNEDARIRQIYGTTGECRLAAVGCAANMNEVSGLSHDLITNIRKLVRVDWEIVSETFKDADKGISYGTDNGR